MKLCLLLLFTFNISVCLAQKEDIRSNHKVVGLISDTGEEIRATEYILPERIERYYLDTVSNRMSIQLRDVRNGKWLSNYGDFILYKLGDKAVQWTKKIAYQADTYEHKGATIIKISAGKSFCLDYDTGEPLWEIRNAIYHTDPMHKVGVGYQIKTYKGLTNTLKGINLKNGQEMWSREISREYGWNDLFYINDSTLLIVAAGLHTVNLKNGSGWDYDTQTGKKDYTKTVATNALGVVGGVLTGTFVTATGHDVIHDMTSNVLVDSTNFYFASKECIAKISKKGNVVWKTTLPESHSSKSSIIVSGQKLLLINKGFAYRGNRKIDIGKPYLAIFDIQTGSQLFNTILSEEKDANVTGFNTQGGSLYLTIGKKINEFSLETGQKLNEKELDEQTIGSHMSILGNQVYAQMPDSTYQSLNLSDTSKLYIYTDKGKILRFKKSLMPDGEISIENVWINYLTKSGYKFIVKSDKSLILNSKNNKVAELVASDASRLIGDKLYIVKENSFTEVDLSKVLKSSD